MVICIYPVLKTVFFSIPNSFAPKNSAWHFIPHLSLVKHPLIEEMDAQIVVGSNSLVLGATRLQLVCKTKNYTLED